MVTAWLHFGHDDSKKQVICRNSWGPGWGDKGYFYDAPMPTSRTGIMADDFWVIEGIAKDELMNAKELAKHALRSRRSGSRRRGALTKARFLEGFDAAVAYLSQNQGDAIPGERDDHEGERCAEGRASVRLRRLEAAPRPAPAVVPRSRISFCYRVLRRLPRPDQAEGPGAAAEEHHRATWTANSLRHNKDGSHAEDLPSFDARCRRFFGDTEEALHRGIRDQGEIRRT